MADLSMFNDEHDNAGEEPAKRYKVETILAKRGVGDGVEYLLKWESFGDEVEDPSWEPIIMVEEHMKDEIADFERRQENKKERREKICKIKGTKRGTFTSSNGDKCDNSVAGSSAGKKYKAAGHPTAQPHRSAMLENVNGSNKGKKKQFLFVCDLPDCGRSFSCQAALSFHKRKDHNKHECRICTISVENQHNSLIASKKDVRAHFMEFHPGVRGDLWFSYVDEYSEPEISETGNGHRNELSAQVPPVSDEINKTQDSTKMELESLKNQLKENDKEIEFLRSQLKSAEAIKYETEKKLMKKEDEQDNSRKQIKQLMKSLSTKETYIDHLLREEIYLQGKCLNLEFKYDQLLLEAEAKNSEMKVKSLGNDKLEVALREAHSKLDREREERRNLESTNTLLMREKEEMQERLKQVEIDKKCFLVIIAEKEEQLESSLARSDQLLECISEKDSRIRLLESKEDWLNKTDNQFEMKPQQQVPEEGQTTMKDSEAELEDCKKRMTEMERTLQETNSQLVKEREEGLDKKSKLEAMTVMWKMKNDKLQKELHKFVKAEITTTADLLKVSIFQSN